MADGLQELAGLMEMLKHFDSKCKPEQRSRHTALQRQQYWHGE
jgi:hypothetical protein